MYQYFNRITNNTKPQVKMIFMKLYHKNSNIILQFLCNIFSYYYKCVAI